MSDGRGGNIRCVPAEWCSMHCERKVVKGQQGKNVDGKRRDL